jgi:hypothetical protein
MPRPHDAVTDFYPKSPRCLSAWRQPSRLAAKSFNWFNQARFRPGSKHIQWLLRTLLRPTASAAFHDIAFGDRRTDFRNPLQ